MHNTFDFDAECTSKLDFTKPGLDKVSAVLHMKVLFLDEAALPSCVSRAHACMVVSHLGGGVRGFWRAQVSMMDEEVFQKILGVLSTADGVRRDGAARSGTVEARDSIGDLHLLLFGDFKQLPPATVIV